MLIALGCTMIAAFMYLILSKRITPVIALILVPITMGLVATGIGIAEDVDGGITGAIMKAIKEFAPTAALLFFAIIYFGLMIDVGLFDPLIRFILRVVGNSPVKVVLGTALLAAAVSLDGDGSTTFIITVSALLPVYRRLGMSPVVLTVVANLANGVLNIVPWGGPTIRAATVLNVSPGELFNPMIPGMMLGVVTVFVLSYFLGRSEKKRLDKSGHTLEMVAAELGSVGGGTGTRHRRADRWRLQRPNGQGPAAGSAGRPDPHRRRPVRAERGREHRALRHGGRPRPEPKDPAAQADLVQPGADPGPAGLPGPGQAAAGPGLHVRRRGRPGGQLPEAEGPGRADHRPRHARSSRWSPWCSPPPSWSACCPAPAWSPRWPTRSSPPCPSRWVRGSPSSPRCCPCR